MQDSTASLIKNESLLREKESEILRLQIELDEVRTTFAEFQMSTKSKVTKLETTIKQKDELITSLGNIAQNSKNASILLKYEEQLKKLETENTKLRKQNFVLGVKAKTRSNSLADGSAERFLDMVNNDSIPEKDKTADYQTADPKAMTAPAPLLSVEEKKEIFSRRRMSSKIQGVAALDGKKNGDDEDSFEDLKPVRERFEEELAENSEIQKESVSAYIDMVQQFEVKLKEKNERLLESESLVSKLKRQAAELESTREKQRRQLKENEETIMNFLSTIDEQKSQIRDLQKDLNKYRDLAEELSESNRKTTARTTKSDDNLAYMTIRVEELDLENRILTDRLNDQIALNEQLKKESLETINTLQTQLGKREIDISKQNTKIEQLLERNHEYLERLDKHALSKNLANEMMEEKHSEEVKKLNEVIIGLRKELADVKLEKMFLEKTQAGNGGEVPVGDNSFRVLGHNHVMNQTGENDEPLGSEIAAISLKDSLQKGGTEVDRHSAESLELEKMVNMRPEIDSLYNDQKPESRGNINARHSPDARDRSRNSSVGRTPLIPIKRKLSIDELSDTEPQQRIINGISKPFQNGQKGSAITLPIMKKTSQSGNPGEFATGPSNISDLVKDIDDPLLQYIAELDEKNQEIQHLRAELRRFETDLEFTETRKRIVTLELEVKHLKENLDQAERLHSEEITFQKQLTEEVTEALTATKMRLSTMASEQDTLIINYNRKIKRLNYQISIYEGQISAFNDSLKGKIDKN